MKLPITLATVVSALLIFVVSAQGADPKVPEYPKQPNINKALKHLSDAKEKAPTNPTEAEDHLKNASIALEKAKNNKGTYAGNAQRLAEQAIKHLEKGEADVAMHEINEAIENAHKAGKTGGR